MGIEIKLTDQQLPVSPVFIDFLSHVIKGKPFFAHEWYEQVSERMSSGQAALLERAVKDSKKVIESEQGQQYVMRAYQLFVALLTGDMTPFRDIQFRFHFINIIGVPRNGGSYLTKELYMALGYEPEKVPNAIAHDGFPDASPFMFEQGVNSWTTSLHTMAEFLTMVEIFFGKAKPHTGKIIVPKKLTKGSYAGGFFHRVLGESVEHILTVRHPVMSCISTYEKSGGLPDNGKFVVRGNIEEWARRDLMYTGLSQDELDEMDYFDAYLRYWEQYHYYIATTGLSANKNTNVVAYGDARMQAQAQRFHNRFESGYEPSTFHVFDRSDMHPEWMPAAEQAIRRVAGVWERVGLEFPVEQVLEGY